MKNKNIREDCKTTRPLYTELRTIYETKDSEPNTFRQTFTLKDLVDGQILRQAVDKTMKRYPYFLVELDMENGSPVFKSNPNPVPVLHTNERTVLGSGQTSGHLLCFCYWNNRLHVDAYHGMTDGGGITPLVKTLLYYYFSDFYKMDLSTDGIQLADSPVRKEEWEDPLMLPLDPERTAVVQKWNQPAFKIEEGGIAKITRDAKVFNMRIPEKTFMRFNFSNDGSPATIVSLLLAKMIEKLHPDTAHPTVIGMCVNQRKALRAPYAHQSLVGDIRLPYTDRLKKMDFSKAATCFRGMVSLQSDADVVLDDIRDQQSLTRYLESLENPHDRHVYCVRQMEERSRSVTATVSYVGKSNMGDLEQFILDNNIMPSTALPSIHVPLTVEISAMNGYFFLNFIQYFQEEDYFSAFVRQFRENEVDYDVLNVREARFPLMGFRIS